jgi:hypothetical protein
MVLGFMACVFFFQLALILSLVAHNRLVIAAYKSESALLTVVEILSTLLTLLSFYASIELQRRLRRQLCMFELPCRS